MSIKVDERKLEGGGGGLGGRSARRKISKDFDNDDFEIMKKRGLGGGAPQNFFAILGAKILLKYTKKS